MTALAADKVIQGYPDGSGRPYGVINRAEILKVLMSANPQYAADVERIRTAMPILPLFDDISQQAWYAPYVEVAYRKGIIKGYPDGYLRPESPVRVEEAIAMLMRAFGEDQAAAGFQSSPELQNVPGEWYADAVSAAIAKRLIIRGDRLQLGAAMRRGQLFEMLYRLREVQSRKLALYDDGGQMIAYQQPSPVYPVQPPSQPNPQITVAQHPQPALSIQPLDEATAMQYASNLSYAITIPALGIKDLKISRPAKTSTQEAVLEPLKTGIGNLFGVPGGGTTSMLYGHSSGYPWDLSPYTKIFRAINKLAVGNRIYVTYNKKLYVYEVTGKKTVSAKDTSEFKAGGTERVVLYTCWPPDSISQRYLVFASLVGMMDLP